MIGSTVIFEYHEMCYPYHIACFHSDHQLSTEQLKAEMCKLLGWDSMDDWYSQSLTFIDHNRLRGLTILGEEIDNDTKRALRRFFPEALKDMGNDHAFGNFSYQYYDAKANEVIWMNQYHDEMKEHLSGILHEAAERYKKERERKNGEENDKG
ncbi:hypothetical protein DQT32_03680 [Salmonella enterica subsp. enterica serovar Braenderup]|nr:hypothetical protein [Salmonella enterica subsp. enterica serovar Braenderup]